MISNKTTPDTDAENQHPHPDPEDAAAKQIIAVILENVDLDPCLGEMQTPLLKFADWRGGQTSVSGSGSGSGSVQRIDSGWSVEIK